MHSDADASDFPMPCSDIELESGNGALSDFDVLLQFVHALAKMHNTVELFGCVGSGWKRQMLGKHKECDPEDIMLGKGGNSTTLNGAFAGSVVKSSIAKVSARTVIKASSPRLCIQVSWDDGWNDAANLTLLLEQLASILIKTLA